MNIYRIRKWVNEMIHEKKVHRLYQISSGKEGSNNLKQNKASRGYGGIRFCLKELLFPETAVMAPSAPSLQGLVLGSTTGEAGIPAAAFGIELNRHLTAAFGA